MKSISYTLFYVLHSSRTLGMSPIHSCATGKYVENGEKPYGPRKFLFTDSRIRDIQPLLSALTAISQERGKSLAQVCSLQIAVTQKKLVYW
jgi:aryl-alcohol dehydrogenase-like predicted oxidoreductase